MNSTLREKLNLAVASSGLGFAGAGYSNWAWIDKGSSGAVSKWSEVRFGQDHQASSYPERFGGNSLHLLSHAFVGGWAKARVDASRSVCAPIQFCGN